MPASVLGTIPVFPDTLFEAFLIALDEQGTPAHLPAEVLVKRKKRIRGGAETWEIVRARGHLDEVQELRASAPQSAFPWSLPQQTFPIKKTVILHE